MYVKFGIHGAFDIKVIDDMQIWGTIFMADFQSHG